MSMDWAAVGRRLADVAPMIGTVLAGPGGTALGAIIASTLGTANDPHEVEKALRADPEALMRVRELEQKEAESLRAHVLGMAQAEMADQQHAREVHKDHWMPPVLTFILAAMVSCTAWGIMTLVIPTDSKEVVFYLVGQLVTAFLTAVAYWLGSSRSSADKNKMLGQRQ